MAGRFQNGESGEVFKLLAIINNFHGPTTQYIGWTNNDRVTNFFSHRYSVFYR